MIPESPFIIEFIAVLIYAVLMTFSAVGAYLYFIAYKIMKRTSIIGSILWLLFALSLDSLFWFYAEFSRLLIGKYPDWILQPIVLIIIKGILTITVIRFILCSIREEKRIFINGKQKILYR